MRKTKKKLPSGINVIRFKRKKPRIARCVNCGKPLHGIPRLQPVEVGKLAKTEKGPERPFGGYYCSSCMRELFKEKARVI